MPKARNIYVTAPPGRVTPVGPHDGHEPGGAQLLVRPGAASIVRFFRADGSTSQTLRRAFLRGDLLACDMNGNLVDSYELAIVPDEPGPSPTKKGDK